MLHIGIDASRAGEQKVTGVEEYARCAVPVLCRELLTRGHHVTVYTTPSFSEPLPANVRIQRLSGKRFWTHSRLGPRTLLDNIDVLFIPSHVLPFLHPRNSVAMLHDACFEEMPAAYNFWHRQYLRCMASFTLHTARAVTHSSAAQASLSRTFYVPAKSIAVVPPAAPSVSSPAVSLPWPTPFFLFLGRLEVRKQAHILLEAFADLLQKHPTLPHHLVLLGKDGYGAEHVHTLWKHHPYRNRLHLPGYVSKDIRDASLRAADAVLLPSACEGSSLVVLEARSVGTPFLVSSAPACTEVAEGQGIVVREYTAFAWAEALATFLHAPTRTPTPSKRSWEDVARDLADILCHTERS